MCDKMEERVMTLRTPRRRISPRTKRRYRAIKDFLRRALGNSSQPDINTNSSIEVSVSDLKSKIIGIEQQLNKVSKHCRDLACLEHSFRKNSESSVVQLQQEQNTSSDKKETNEHFNNNQEVETRLLYKSSNKSHVNSNVIDMSRHDDRNDMTFTNQTNIQGFQYKQKNIDEDKRNTNDKNKYDSFVPHQRASSKYKTRRPVYSTSSFHSLVESGNKHYSKHEITGRGHDKKYSRIEYVKPLTSKEHRDKEIRKDLRNHEKVYDYRHKTKRTKRNYSEVDKDFIADIINRQYRPVKLFGRKDSDFSQFSAPVCRDQEFKIRAGIEEDSELCSCCFDNHGRKKHRYICNTDLTDMRSVCDTRLYSSKKHRRYKYTRAYIDDYNNSALYDVVPVKEKSSPKSRRKFVEDNMLPYQYCKEVPPSPKSHRPRLNLKVQHYTDDEDSLLRGRRQIRKSPPLRQLHNKVTNMTESEVSSEVYRQKIQTESLNKSKSQKPNQIQENVGTMSSLQYPNFVNEHANFLNNDTTLNTHGSDSTADKTDKTLLEIKDILHSFLLEIKKETSNSEKSDLTSKIENKLLTQHQETKINNNMLPNSGHSFNNYSVGQCTMSPFLSTLPNSCCYPILPVCPMNCLQNGYILPSPSYTCNVCAKNSKPPSCQDQASCYDKNKMTEETNTNNETQELIKEIYKFVSQTPKSPRTKEERSNENKISSTKDEQHLFDKRLLTSRSVGGSTKASKQDANVGTPKMKCYSRSCEAIGSRNPSDTYNTNASYSDTILEKLSLEVTQSSSETELSTEVLEEKVKRGKLKKVLNSLRLFKKKKRKDIIEELSESESTVEVDVKSKPPFKQHITNYAMHGQEYFHPPPIPGQHCCRSPPPDFYGHGYTSRNGYSPSPLLPPHDSYNQVHHPHNHSAHYSRTKYATAPTCPGFDIRSNQISPQIPLCLKEIEVKSIGTQSERKVSILRKLTTKYQPPVQQAPRFSAAPEKPSFWKSLQEKAKQNSNDPMDFSLKTQKELAQGDMKLRNAMLKKMFYKRNPFSPRNLIIRTLLGKDKSSYGDPPKMYRPRMFL